MSTLNFKLKFKKMTLFFCMLTFMSEVCFADETTNLHKIGGIYVDGQRIKSDPNTKAKNIAKGAGVTAAAGGFFLPPLVAIGMSMPSAGAAGGGLAALSGAALVGASWGIGLGVAAGVGLTGYGVYKLNERYKSRLMGLSSKDVRDISIFAEEHGGDSEFLIQESLKKKLDKICGSVSNGKAEADMDHVKTKTKTTDWANYLNGDNELTAYNEKGNKQTYRFYKNKHTGESYKHIVVSKLACKAKGSELNSILSDIDPDVAEVLLNSRAGQMHTSNDDNIDNELFYGLGIEPKSRRHRHHSHRHGHHHHRSHSARSYVSNRSESGRSVDSGFRYAGSTSESVASSARGL